MIISRAKRLSGHRDQVGEAEVMKNSRVMAMLKRDQHHPLFTLNMETLKSMAVKTGYGDISKEKGKEISDNVFVNPRPKL